MKIKGFAKKGLKTKELVNYLESNDIPVIFHEDIDEVAANSLIERGVKAVINCKKSLTGKYPAQGAKCLLDSGIILIDNFGEDFFRYIKHKDYVKIEEGNLYINDNIYNGKFNIVDKELINNTLKENKSKFDLEFKNFIKNTIEYADKEKEYIFSTVKLPSIDTKISKRHVLIVARGHNYVEDLHTVKKYIEKVSPVLIGVDGGGDALLDIGYIPDLIVGDMDSVSDECLLKSKEVIVHAYRDGTAPGYLRVRRLDIEAKIFPFLGTSEDVAMLLAYENNAELIVAIGTHSNIIDFFDKGRNGMSSTMLVRLKIGSKLVDAKGINKLFIQ